LLSEEERQQLLQWLPECDRAELQGTAHQAAAAAAAAAPAAAFSSGAFKGALEHYNQLLAAGLLEAHSNSMWLRVGSGGVGGVCTSTHLSRQQRAQARAEAKAGRHVGGTGSSSSKGSSSGSMPAVAPGGEALREDAAAAAGGGMAAGSSGGGGGRRVTVGVLGYLERVSGPQVAAAVLDRRLAVPDALLGMANSSL
jgi:hypothetical protein